MNYRELRKKYKEDRKVRVKKRADKRANIEVLVLRNKEGEKSGSNLNGYESDHTWPTVSEVVKDTLEDMNEVVDASESLYELGGGLE